MTDLHADTDLIARMLTDGLEDMLDRMAPGWVLRRGAGYPRPHPEKGSLGSWRVELTGAKRGQWYRHSQDVGGGALKLFAYLHSGEQGAALDRGVFDAARAFLGLPSPFGAGEAHDAEAAAARRAAAEARAKARAAEHQKAAAEYRLRQGARAKDLWAASRPAAGTLVEAWFAARGLAGAAIPPTIRFHPAAPYFVVDVVPDDRRGAEAGAEPGRTRRIVREVHRGPAMVAAVQHGRATRGDLRGVHVTWLSADGRAKAAITDPETGEVMLARKMIGPAKGGHVRLSPAADLLAIAEGIETAMSIQHFAGLPTFAALSLSNLGAPLPAAVSSVVLCFDSDERVPAKAARMKAEAMHEHAARGLMVRTCAAPAGMDFNDVAMAAARGAAGEVA